MVFYKYSIPLKANIEFLRCGYLPRVTLVAGCLVILMVLGTEIAVIGEIRDKIL